MPASRPAPGASSTCHKRSAGGKGHWPTDGWPGAAYTREKAYLECVLDAFEPRHPQCRVVRLRPAFIFQRKAAQEQRRIFGGPLVPNIDVRRQPAVLDIPRLRFQTIGAADVVEAYRLARWATRVGCSKSPPTHPSVLPNSPACSYSQPTDEDKQSGLRHLTVDR